VELAVAAGCTSRIGLATSVTNPVTRHPGVTAAAVASLQVESAGRAVLGIGRGDSALAHIGLSPAPVPVFERYLRRLQGYLRGEEVPFDLDTDAGGSLRAATSLGMADAPQASRLRWLASEVPKVPVDVTASGPRMIALGAQLAERVTLAVGVDPERVRWAIGLANEARAAGRELDGPPDGRSLGVFVAIAVHPDRDRARSLVSGAVGSIARFSVMHGSVVGPADDGRRRALEAVYRAYDMNSHFAHGSSQAEAVSDDLVDAFAIAGPASFCVDRLLELAEMGVGRIVVAPGAAAAGAARDELRDSRKRLVEEVLPALR
jgi:5,10-methylenetetrahydromethanopterin reductase